MVIVQILDTAFLSSL